VESENIKVEYCPTEKMIADFFTKPLQGNLFRKFRDVVMGYKHISSLYDQSEQTLAQERVGNDENGILVKNHKRPNIGNSKKMEFWTKILKGLTPVHPMVQGEV
jgi:hypothetical protein